MPAIEPALITFDLDHILVATDLSAAARRCYPAAAAFARALDARVTVLHVDEVTVSLRTLRAFAAHLDTVVVRRAAALADLERDFASLETPVSVVVAPGDARHIIDAHARATGAGLLVIARCARTGPERPLLGSTTRRVLALSEAPVLVVPAADEDAPLGPVPAYRRLLVATDRGATSSLAVRAALGLARALGGQVTAAHVLHWPKLAALRPGETSNSLPQTEVEQLRADTEADLAREVRTAGGLEDTGVVVVGSESPAEALAELAAEADLVVVPATGKGALARVLLGSTTERLAALSPVPILVLPQSWLEARA